MKKQRMVLLGSLALVILLSVVLIILMTSPQQEQPQESSQTDQQQELGLLWRRSIPSRSKTRRVALSWSTREADLLWKAMRRWRPPVSTSTI